MTCGRVGSSELTQFIGGHGQRWEHASHSEGGERCHQEWDLGKLLSHWFVW